MSTEWEKALRGYLKLAHDLNDQIRKLHSDKAFTVSRLDELAVRCEATGAAFKNIAERTHELGTEVLRSSED